MATLEELLVSGREINRELVADLLQPFVRIDAEECQIIPTASWGRLSNESKSLIYLLARKAMTALDLPIPTEGATPREIERATGVVGNSLRPVLRRLLAQRMVAKSEGRYYVPNHALENAKLYLRERVGGYKYARQ